jgi:hypothetical protein
MYWPITGVALGGRLETTLFELFDKVVFVFDEATVEVSASVDVTVLVVDKLLVTAVFES